MPPLHESILDFSEIPPVILDAPFADDPSGLSSSESCPFEPWSFPKRTWAMARRRRIKHVSLLHRLLGRR